MRSAQLIEEEEEIASESELNLGLGSLLGIFFGLALVCGVFFGFGYMLGHRGGGAYVPSEPLYESPKTAATMVAPKPSAEVAAQPLEASRVVVPNTEPGATSPTANVAAEGPAPNVPSPTARALVKTSAAMPTAALLATAPVTKAQPTTKAATIAPASLAPTQVSGVPQSNVAAPGSGFMVQIAAVKNRPDAEALAAALAKDGFSATVRTESQDKFLHVQLGPFPSRDDAKVMRQKLSSAGYNAFIK